MRLGTGKTGLITDWERFRPKSKMKYRAQTRRRKEIMQVEVTGI